MDYDPKLPTSEEREKMIREVEEYEKKINEELKGIDVKRVRSLFDMMSKIDNDPDSKEAIEYQ